MFDNMNATLFSKNDNVKNELNETRSTSKFVTIDFEKNVEFEKFFRFFVERKRSKRTNDFQFAILFRKRRINRKKFDQNH